MLYRCAVLLLLVLALVRGVRAEPAEDPSKFEDLLLDLKTYSGEQYCRAEVLAARKMVHIKIPPECWPRMLDGGGKTMAYMMGCIFEYFDAMGYKGLNEQGSAGQMAAVEQTLNELSPRFSLTYVYAGPNEEAAWTQGGKYLSTVYFMLGRYGGWVPKSGTAHITVLVTPSVKTTSATSDGSTFKVTAPCFVEVSVDEWEKTVGRVFQKYKK